MPHTDAVPQRPAWLRHKPVLEQLTALDGVLQDALYCPDTRLGAAALHLVRRGGKRLRPTLLFLAAAAVRPLPPASGQSPAAAEEQLLAMAGAVELLHVASLYHDDVMDRADVRRGGRTANALWGEATAVTAGTFIIARAMRLLAGLDPLLASWAADSALALTLGQLQEVENTHHLDHRLESYLQIAARKTAALFELSCRAGAYLGGAARAEVDALGRYGRCVGMAFQAADDMLDITSSETALGKTPGTDLREGVYGLPVLIALGADSAGSRRLRALLGRSGLDDGEVAQAHELITAAGGVIGAGNIAQDFAHQAVMYVTGLPDTAARQSLIGLTDHIVLRRH